MATSHWKDYQPNIQDSAVLAYHTVDPFSSNSNDIPSSGSLRLRETGIIEKLLHSYGFIQCCERKTRLFFHYSQLQGNLENLHIGDPVEFEMTFDRRTGKPIASGIVKIDPEIVTSGSVMNGERVTGTVTTEIKRTKDSVDCQHGRISYENRGECFFLPYTSSDLVDPSVQLNCNDVVTFQIASDPQNGFIARNVKLDKSDQPVLYQGVVCSLKDSFGFIERADVVKEIFFHFSECKTVKDLKLGDDVQFSIQTRNNKEVAINIELLAEGTVIFEDVSTNVFKGKVIKNIDRGQSQKFQTDPLPGRISYRADNEEKEIPYGDRDLSFDYTLNVNDIVEFNIATDRRDNLQRASNIRMLIDESISSSEEAREKGIVLTVKEGFGFIKCANRDQPRLFFHFNEMLDPKTEIKVQDEVEFLVAQDPGIPSRQNAIRIRRLPKGSVSFEHQNNSRNMINGIIEVEPANQWFRKSVNKNDENGRETETGIISYFNVNNIIEKAKYFLKDCSDPKNLPKANDKVQFILCDVNDGELAHATDVKLSTKTTSNNILHKNGYRYNSKGYIAAVRENFGFIETADHSREIFFHFSIFDGDSNKLEPGQEVEYCLSQKSANNNNASKLSAEMVRIIPNGSLPVEEICSDVLSGTILRPIRCFNPDQDEYSGLVQVKSEENGNSPIYSFGITSLVDKKVFVQTGDIVEFQVGHIVGNPDTKRAMCIKVVRDHYQGTVEAIKGQYGFLSHEVEEGKKLFFHKSEVNDGRTLKQGDVVDFVIVKNHRNGRSSACDVKLVSEAVNNPTTRPEHLTRLRNLSLSQDDNNPRIVTVRQPFGPVNNSNFKNHPMLLS